MAKIKTSNKSKHASPHNKTPKISPLHCPKDMTQKEWQCALRRQAAESETLGVSAVDAEGCLFEVRNSKSGRSYAVEYFGRECKYNRCECMDFRTNQLGTCKHIESVAMFRKGRYATVKQRQPPHSSVVVDYPAGRKLMLRIGQCNAAEMLEAMKGIFDKNGILTSLECDPSGFNKKAHEIDPEFKWEDDALNILLCARDKKRRVMLLENKYSNSDFTGLIKTRLHKYQTEGVKFAFAEGRTINADEMGLGKTVQAIATAELLKKEGMVQTVIIICPTSLKYQWLAEIKRFTDSSVMVVEGDMLKRREQLDDQSYFYKICSFHAVTNNVKAGFIPSADMIIYDELQRLKNWETQMGRQLRKLTSEYVMALSGTPLENKLSELYSVTQFVDQFLLGPLYKFTDETTIYDDAGRIVGYKNLHKVSERMNRTMIRRRKSDVKLQMPGRTDTNMFVPMTKEQRAIHDEYKFQVSILIDKWRRFKFLSETDRKRLLLLLSMMRMVCDSTYILDQKTRHDTKIDEVKEIVRNMLESSDEKVVIFSQWERMLRILAQELAKDRLNFCFLHGSVPSAKRKDLIDRFRDDPECRIFLSTDAGSTGLNLQSASLLINLDLPWNPAVLEQRIARIYRLGQQNPVQIINMVARDTIEERMLATLKFKSNLAAGILDGGNDAVFLEDNKFGKIIDMVEGTLSDDGKDINSETDAPAAEIKGNPEENKEDSEENKDGNAQAMSSHDKGYDAEKSEVAKKSEDAEKKEVASHKSNSEGAPAASGGNDTDKKRQHPVADRRTPSGGGGNHSNVPAGDTGTTKSREEIRDVIAVGLNFLGAIANMLAEPEGAQKLADAIVKEDPSTGKTTLNIPIPDKNTVVNIFNSIASMLRK